MSGSRRKRPLCWRRSRPASGSVQEQDIRKASHDLYPSIVKVGLVPSVRSLCERFRSVLPVELYIEPAIEAAEENNWRTFPEELKIGIYRMVEEAMDNVIKHARAEVASVELYREMGGHICLDVADDGRGFETGKSSSVLGLLAMNDYAEALGGRCRIRERSRAGDQSPRLNSRSSRSVGVHLECGVIHPRLGAFSVAYHVYTEFSYSAIPC